MHRHGPSATVVVLAAAFLLGGCTTPQSAIDDAMEEARSERERAQERDSASEIRKQHDDAIERMDRRREQQ